MFKRIDHVEIVTDQLDRTCSSTPKCWDSLCKPETGSSVRVWVCLSIWSIWI